MICQTDFPDDSEAPKENECSPLLEIWNAKFHFVKNTHRLSNVRGNFYGLMSAEEAAVYYNKEIEEEFNKFVSVNKQYLTLILESLKPFDNQVLTSTVAVEFEIYLVVASWRGNHREIKKQHSKEHSSAEVSNLTKLLKSFVEKAEETIKNESSSSIISLMDIHTKCHNAIIAFKLFEQE